MIAFFIAVSCPIPDAIHAANPTPREIRQLERYAFCKCGPDGTVDWDPNPQSPPPHCNRDGWNGRRYRPEGR